MKSEVLSTASALLGHLKATIYHFMRRRASAHRLGDLAACGIFGVFADVFEVARLVRQRRRGRFWASVIANSQRWNGSRSGSFLGSQSRVHENVRAQSTGTRVAAEHSLRWTVCHLPSSNSCRHTRSVTTRLHLPLSHALQRHEDPSRVARSALCSSSSVRTRTRMASRVFVHNLCLSPCLARSNGSVERRRSGTCGEDDDDKEGALRSQSCRRLRASALKALRPMAPPFEAASAAKSLQYSMLPATRTLSACRVGRRLLMPFR